MSSRWWSTARSIRSLSRRVEIFFFKRMLRNGSNMIFLRIHRDPPWPLSVKPHTTGLNFSSILTKQCISFNPTHWYLNIPLDQTHPFLKGFYCGNTWSNNFYRPSLYFPLCPHLLISPHQVDILKRYLCIELT